MDIGGCRLLDGDGDGGGLVADLHAHLGGAGLDAVDGADAGDRRSVPDAFGWKALRAYGKYPPPLAADHVRCLHGEGELCAGRDP